MMFFARAASSIYDAALSLLYPQACAVCGASVESRRDGVACDVCWRKTRVFSGQEMMCWKCGELAAEAATVEPWAEINCRRCEADAFTVARACGVYEKALQASILALKVEPYVPARLAQLLWETQQRGPLNQATLIVPVPLHPAREKERGFNQAAILARSLAKLAGLPLDELSLIRTLYVERHRAGMDARSRRESVSHAFHVQRPRLIEGERILLIDDVFTTGATVSSCSSALRAAGASDVFVLTVARPLMQAGGVRG